MPKKKVKKIVETGDYGMIVETRSQAWPGNVEHYNGRMVIPTLPVGRGRLPLRRCANMGLSARPCRKDTGSFKRVRMPRAKNSGALTEQQKLFSREFLVDRNATAAAIRAGYSAASANTN